nr:immunoglobulin light chain junction region [Macaca mulatta]MOW57724.1 immunoglobulin light chain junction region [Macaca mulatta]
DYYCQSYDSIGWVF